jgi:hypothetical protein
MGDKEGVDQMMAPPALNSALNSQKALCGRFDLDLLSVAVWTTIVLVNA